MGKKPQEVTSQMSTLSIIKTFGRNYPCQFTVPKWIIKLKFYK